MALKDPAITAITAAMPTGTSLDMFQKAIPDRFYDVGIAEGTPSPLRQDRPLKAETSLRHLLHIPAARP